jgi:hypothetical protein
MCFVVRFQVSGERGRVVVEALCYKPDGRGFEPDESSDFISIYLILPAAISPGVYSASILLFIFYYYYYFYYIISGE